MRRRRTNLAVLFLIAVVLIGCTGPQTFSVGGRVTDSEGNGIPGVLLHFSGGFGMAETDEGGNWRKDGLVGEVHITASKEGWVIYNQYYVGQTASDINFTGVKATYPLTVSITGRGTVEQESPQDSNYEHGTQVELTAVPEHGWRFSHWEGDVQGEEHSALLLMDSTKSVTAVFVALDYALGIAVEGQGKVDQEVLAVALGTRYDHGTQVKLTAVPENGWGFSHWEGDLQGRGNPAVIEVDGEKSVTAVFVRLEYTLTVNKQGEGKVSVTPEQAVYYYGDTVELAALPSAGFAFSEWTGDLSGYENPVSITMTDDMELTAVFAMSIQAAIDAAQDGDTIVVPPGTYHENIDFRGKNITLQSEDPSDWGVVEATILNGRASGPVVSFACGEGRSAVLRGFTITNGYGRNIEGNSAGGGVIVIDSAPTIANNLIVENEAFFGSGVYVRGDSAQPIIQDNIIKDNNGEGIYTSSQARPAILGNTIIGNTSGGIVASRSYTTITDNIIAGNSSGVYIWFGSATVERNEIKDNRNNGVHTESWVDGHVLIKDNRIVGNYRGIRTDSPDKTTITGNYIADNDATRFWHSSDQDGGGILYKSSSSNPPAVSNNTLENNKARNGGAISITGQGLSLSNNEIRNNEAEYGAGIHVTGGGKLTLEGNTIEGNTAKNEGGGVYVSFTSSLFTLTGNSIAGNSPDEIYHE